MSDLPDPFELLGVDPPTSDTSSTGSAPPPPPAGDDDFVWLDDGDGPRRRRRWPWVVLAVVALIVVLGASTAWWIDGKINPGGTGDAVAFTVAPGATTSQISSQMARQNIISSASIFDWYVKFNGGDPFQAGDYDGMRTNMAMGDALAVLRGGPAPPKVISFLVREGLWISETKKAILTKFPAMTPEALDAALRNTHPPLQPAGSTNLEGFLFPATYEVQQADAADAQKLVDQMLAAFDRVSQAEGLPDAAAKLKGVAGNRTITPYDALIVASLVESEAKVDEDRPKIARVIYNRLARGETLGIDASVLYALQERKATLLDKDLKVDSPYNTRLKAGLPPTPINSPGQKSIHAALNPEPGNWLYYVLTDKDGHHYFTNSASDFARAVADAKSRGVF